MSNLGLDQEQEEEEDEANAALRRQRNDAFRRRRRRRRRRLLRRGVGPSRPPLYMNDVEKGRDGREAKRTFHFECRES